MSDSSIEWTEKVWTPLRGVPENLGEPLRWRKPAKVFVNSMSDLFHEDVPDEYIAAVFGVMAAAPQHTFQLITKRPARMKAWFEWVAEQGRRLVDIIGETPPNDSGEIASACAIMATHRLDGDLTVFPAYRAAWPLPNVWLGVSVENQATADERIPLLLDCPAAVRWISAEPLLGPVDFGRFVHCYCGEPLNRHRNDALHTSTPMRESLLDDLDWVVVGGESGRGARACNTGDIREVVEQCARAGVPCFVKQLGAAAVEDYTRWVPHGHPDEGQLEIRGVGLRDKKGGDPAEWPDDLRVREYPR